MISGAGVRAEQEHTLLTARALDFLASGPADVVDLIGHVCNLPRAPRIVAEHMAHAMFAGRPEFFRQENGFWRVAEPGAPAYAVSGDAGAAPQPVDLLKSHSFVVVDVETT